MREILGQAQIIFVHADGHLVPEQGVNVFGPVLLLCSKMTFFLNLFSGPCFFLEFGQSFVDFIADGSDIVVISWNWGSVFGVDNA
jgi:hypothetical protein